MSPLANVVKLTPVLIDVCCTHLSLINSGVTGPKFTKFLHDVERSSLLLMRPSSLQYFNPFRNAGVTNKGEQANFADFALKLVAMATSLERSGVIYDQIPTIRWKCGKNRSSRS